MAGVVVGSESHQLEHLNRILQQLGNRQLFGIFIGDASTRIDELAGRLTEFVSWPATTEELNFRLGRFRGLCKRQLASTEVSDIDPGIARLTMIGDSAPFLEALSIIGKIAKCDAVALIEGETGTGKELAARAIHYQSSRSSGPFVPVNCGLLSETLLANELFGHERGAYTDASDNHQGLIAQADGGSLFLDEVDALCARGQVSLLRVFEEKRFRPLGSCRSQPANIRLLSASNRPLIELVEQGEFRADLYYRLSELVVRMPTLDDRGHDVELLAQHFVDRCNRQWHQNKTICASSIERLLQYDWPGNVRELQNLINREYLMQEGPTIQLGLPAADSSSMAMVDAVDLFEFAGTSFNEAKARILYEFEENYLQWLLRQTGGNVTLAARRAGKERRSLGKLLKKHSIDRSAFDRRDSATP